MRTLLPGLVVLSFGCDWTLSANCSESSSRSVVDDEKDTGRDTGGVDKGRDEGSRDDMTDG